MELIASPEPDSSSEEIPISNSDVDLGNDYLEIMP